MSAPLVALSPMAAVVSCSDTAGVGIKTSVKLTGLNVKASEVKTAENLKKLIVAKQAEILTMNLEGLAEKDITDVELGNADDIKGTLEATFGLNYTGSSGTFKVDKTKTTLSGFKTSSDTEDSVSKLVEAEAKKVDDAYDNKDTSKKLKLKNTTEVIDAVLLKVMENKFKDPKTNVKEFLNGIFDNFPEPAQDVKVKIAEFELKQKSHLNFTKITPNKTLTFKLSYEKDGKTASTKLMSFDLQETTTTEIDMIKIAIEESYDNGWFVLKKDTLTASEAVEGNVLKEDDQSITNWTKIKQNILTANGFTYAIKGFKTEEDKNPSEFKTETAKLLKFQITITKTTKDTQTTKDTKEFVFKYKETTQF